MYIEPFIGPNTNTLKYHTNTCYLIPLDMLTYCMYHDEVNRYLTYLHIWYRYIGLNIASI